MTKNFYITLAKTPQKQSQKINDSKSHIWSLSFSFVFSIRNSQNQQKLVKKDQSFYNKVLLKKTHSSYGLQCTQHSKNYTPVTQPKTLEKVFQMHHY